MRTSSNRLGRYAALALIIVVPAILWTQRWNIHDTLRLRGYTPPAEIVQLATDSSLNDPARRLFYVYHPQLEAKTDFSGHCSLSEKTIVLGCYVTGKGIYLYNVTDVRLDGIKQVTAAHETLHVAYDRLSGSERTRVGELINAAFATITDERIKNTVEEYRRNGADVTNELHSILGTEVRTLPPELEQYYARYFMQRSKVVEYSEKYEQVFTERKQKLAQADQQLASLKQQIDAGETNLNNLSKELQSERARLDGLLASKDYAAYNAAVPGFNARVTAYNAQVGQVRRLIDQYNTLVAQRNAIATEESELIKAIDSRPNTIQTQ